MGKANVNIIIDSTYGSVVSRNASYWSNGVIYVDALIDISAQISANHQVLSLTDSAGTPIVLNSRQDAMLIGLNIIPIWCSGDNSIFLSNNNVIPVGLYKITMIIKE